MRLFGIPAIDRLFGDIPAGARIALQNDPGINVNGYFASAIQTARDDGRPIIVVAVATAPTHLKAALGNAGGDDIQWIDAHSGAFHDPLPCLARLRDPASITSLARALAKAQRSHPDALVCIDSLSTLIDRNGANDFEDDSGEIFDALSGFAVSLLGATRWPYDIPLSQLLHEADAVIDLFSLEDQLIRNQGIRVSRIDWQSEPDLASRLWHVDDHGRLALVVPKLVMVGPEDAGKQTLLRAVATDVSSAEHGGVNVALSHGRFEADGVQADLFCAPGQARFDPLLGHHLSNALGVALVVDATQPAAFERARTLMEAVSKRGLYSIVIANKQDLPGAASADEIATALHLPKRGKVLGLSAKDPTAARHAMGSFVDEILSHGQQATTTAATVAIGGDGQ